VKVPPLMAVLMAGIVTLPAVGGTGGSWSATSVGGRVTVGQQTLVSRPLSPPASLPAHACVTRVSWRITLLSPPPPGLQFSLCTRSGCYSLPGLSGTHLFRVPLQANQAFHFVYRVDSAGPLIPALQVVSNQLTVNYQ